MLVWCGWEPKKGQIKWTKELNGLVTFSSTHLFCGLFDEESVWVGSTWIWRGTWDDWNLRPRASDDDCNPANLFLGPYGGLQDIWKFVSKDQNSRQGPVINGTPRTRICYPYIPWFTNGTPKSGWAKVETQMDPNPNRCYFTYFTGNTALFCPLLKKFFKNVKKAKTKPHFSKLQVLFFFLAII